MDGENRRKEITQRLLAASQPISASSFAKDFSVSRQIIVGDIALLRAAGTEINATARGYVLAKEKQGIVRKVVCQHTPDQITEELTIIVALGGEIVDVVVEHPIYGELTGLLHISTEKEIADFVRLYENCSAALLSELTSGIHLHTIRCANEAAFESIKKELAAKGILYQE
jgi:transcriptional regulator of NAD metabolism